MLGTSQKGEQKFMPIGEYAKRRIVGDMVGTAKKHANLSKDYLIMIVDEASCKVFSSCCKAFDIYQTGLFHIERLEFKRKKFPKKDCIYFVQPTKASVQRILQDFEFDEDTEKP